MSQRMVYVVIYEWRGLIEDVETFKRSADAEVRAEQIGRYDEETSEGARVFVTSLED